jgi:hypothetical protein
MKHRHAVIILWFQQTHYHTIIIVWLVWVRMTHRYAIIFLLVWVNDTSTCCTDRTLFNPARAHAPIATLKWLARTPINTTDATFAHSVVACILGPTDRISKEALFKGGSTRFGLQTVEKCFPGKRIRKGSSKSTVRPSKIFVWGP